eukprot:4894414-Prymnesium_polylepis.1
MTRSNFELARRASDASFVASTPCMIVAPLADNWFNLCLLSGYFATTVAAASSEVAVILFAPVPRREVSAIANEKSPSPTKRIRLPR